MKRAGNLYERIAEPENLRHAFLKAIRGKRGKAEVLEYTTRLDENLRRLREQLMTCQVDVGHYHFFTVHDPKERVICAAAFPERVLHHAIMNVCEPVLERYAIRDSYACRTGKGMHAAVLRARAFCRQFPWYLKLDVRKYFDSIDHETLLTLLKRRFKDKAVLRLIAYILATYQTSDRSGAGSPVVSQRDGMPEGPGATPAGRERETDGTEAVPPGERMERRPPFRPPGAGARGLPIGNLLSQHMANFYLGHLDHWIKETLRVCGYVRYMDDCVVWAEDKAALRMYLQSIRAFLDAELHVEIKDKVQINRCCRGLPFLGYRVFANRLTLGPRARRRFARKLRGYENEWLEENWSEADLARHMEALLSYVRFADTLALRRQIAKRFSVAA